MIRTSSLFLAALSFICVFLFNVLAQSSPTLAGVFRYTSVILIVIALIISRRAFFGLD